MAAEWHYAIDGKQFGPVNFEELQALADNNEIQPDDLVWSDSLTEWTPAKKVEGLFSSKGRSTTKKARPRDEEEEDVFDTRNDRKRRSRDEDDIEEEDDYEDRPRGKGKKAKRGRGVSGLSERELREVSSKKMTAGILALLLGGWGIHKFYLGMTGSAVIHILLCFGGFGIISLIEGIIYLTKSDEEFYETYIVGKKGFF